MIPDLHSIFSSWLYTCNPISVQFKICRNSCVPNGYIKTTICENWCVRSGEYFVCQFLCWPAYSSIFRYQVWGDPGLPTFRWTSFPLFLRCQVFVGPHIPLFWGARFGEYLVCQLLVGPHVPLFLRCQVWGLPGLPTFRWTSCSPIFEVPGMGSTWSANF